MTTENWMACAVGGGDTSKHVKVLGRRFTDGQDRI